MKALIVSDIHGNLAAMQAVLAAEKNADLVVCLGDLVDYGPQPSECIKLVREVADYVIQGNHDYAVGNDSDAQCSAEYHHISKVTQDFADRVLTQSEKSYLSHLPLKAQFKVGDTRFTAVHAAPTDPLFMYRGPDTPDTEWSKEIVVGSNPDMLLLGHTHFPLIKKVNSTVIVNPGSVGQPKDGDPRAAYAVWIDGDVILRRAEYDIAATVKAFDQTGLNLSDINRLTAILKSGEAVKYQSAT